MSSKLKKGTIEPMGDILVASVEESGVVDSHENVRVAAYYLAEKRGFEPGYEQEDWVEAEDMLAELAVE